MILHISTTHSYLSASVTTPKTHSSRPAIEFVLFQHSQTVSTSRNFILALKITFMISTPVEIQSIPKMRSLEQAIYLGPSQAQKRFLVIRRQELSGQVPIGTIWSNIPPWGMIHHLGGVFDHYVVKYPSCTQLSRLRKVSWSTLKFPFRTLEKSYTGPKSQKSQNKSMNIP